MMWFRRLGYVNMVSLLNYLHWYNLFHFYFGEDQLDFDWIQRKQQLKGKIKQTVDSSKENWSKNYESLSWIIQLCTKTMKRDLYNQGPNKLSADHISD